MRHAVPGKLRAVPQEIQRWESRLRNVYSDRLQQFHPHCYAWGHFRQTDHGHIADVNVITVTPQGWPWRPIPILLSSPSVLCRPGTPARVGTVTEFSPSCTLHYVQ